MKHLLIILLLSPLTGVYSQESESDTSNISASIIGGQSGQYSNTGFHGLRVFTENDMLSFANNADDNYTGGLKVEYITNQLEFLRLGKIFKKEKWIIGLQNISYGFTVFTPENLGVKEVIRTDRPYACYEFISIGSSFIKSPKYNSIFGYEFYAGYMGSNKGKDLQTKIHGERWFGTTRVVPEGWHNQIADKNAVAINLRLFNERKIFETKPSGNLNLLEGIWVHEVNVGQYLINYSQALRLNLFNVNTAFGKSNTILQGPVLPKKANPSSEPILSSTPTNGTKEKAFSLHCYITPRIRVVGHNVTLTGNLLSRSSEYTIAQKDVIPAVIEYDLGLNVRWCFVNAGAYLSGRSREFKFQEKASHNWGGVYLGFVVKDR